MVSGERIRFTPPASAASHSRLRRLCTARWTPTRPDEQAVSTARLGPCRSRIYDTRLAAMLSALPGADVGVDMLVVVLELGGDLRVVGAADADEHARGRAAHPFRGQPGDSNASQATSSSSRCCGSMREASRGEMPKNCGSNLSTSSTKPGPADRHLARLLAGRIEERVDVPARRRDLAGGVDAVADQPPEGVQIGARRETGTPCRRSRSAPPRAFRLRSRCSRSCRLAGESPASRSARSVIQHLVELLRERASSRSP